MRMSFRPWFFNLLTNACFQNDNIEKAASERFTIYRKCVLEEIRIPLVSGSLKSVPLEQVRMLVFIYFYLA